MKKNSLFIGLFLVIILVVLAVVLATGSFGLGGGYKATVRGTVSYSSLPIVGGWSCDVDNVLVSEDGLFGLWYWPWDTKDINVKVQIDNKNGEVWLGTVSSWLGGSKDYEVVVHGLEPGSYTGQVSVYEVEKGFLGWGESNRVLKTSKSFGVVI